MELKAIAREPKQKLPEGYVPAVAYNKDRNLSFAVEAKAFDRAFRAQSTHGLIDIAIEGGETVPALVKSVQMDKRRRTVVHADFFLVTYGQEIEVPVPVHTSGKARGVVEGGILDIVLHNLQIVAPGPRRIPAEIVVDVTNLAIGDSIKAGDIQLPQGCKLAVDADVAVVAVVPPQKIVETTDEDVAADVPAQQDDE
ncbi:50S ribosomal protein L25 [Deinococcus pimensis]|uniref:50S ribosomal protein L25 n=1 Tax=Deinococcus pimensis TaxID=309888 RepID=UPI0004B4C96E|nr:50S ribosomal protein L25 [Deinococcus pimensis]